MAVLKSSDGHSLLALEPYRREHQGEDWILVRLLMQSRSTNFDTSGAFLTVAELRLLCKGLRALVSDGLEGFELEPIEPNFALVASSTGHGMFDVQAGYSYDVDLREEIDTAVTSHKHRVAIQPTTAELTDFATMLEKEIDNIKPAEP